MKKRILAMVLAVVMVCVLLPTAALAADSDFTIDSNGVLLEYNGSGGDVVIPDGVTSIEDHAFRGCTSLTSVIIPDGVTSIGYRMFEGCTSLTSVTIPDSVTSIEDHAFGSCTSLTSVTIPDSVTTIGMMAFSGCTSLTSVTIPDSVTSIEESAFSRCTSLTSVTIPDSVTTIGRNAFWKCTSLTSVTIPDSVTSIRYGAFSGCTSLTSVTISDSVTSIGGGMFSGCTSLTSVTIPDSVTIIDGSVFDDCTSLTSVAIPDSVTSIGAEAFRKCTSLTSVTIPDSVTTIGMNVFSGCTSLTSVTIPDGVTSIRSGAFSGCTSLTSVTIPDSVTAIEGRAFNGCSNLTDVYYGGTEAQWKAININSEKNDPLYSATIHYMTATPKVTVTLNGGTGSATLTLNTDGTLKKPADPTREGYIFAGWYTDSSFTTQWDFSDKVTGDMNLYARWLPAAKIILQLNGQTTTIDTAKNEPMNVPTNPTREGYNFAGWYIDAALTTPWNFNTAVTGDMSLYARWTPISSTATETGRSQANITFNGVPIALEAYALAADSNGGDVTFVRLRDVAAVLDSSEAQFNVDWKNGAISVSTNTPYTTKNGAELQPIVVNTTGYKWNTNPILFDGETKPLEGIVITDVNGGGHTFFKLRDLAAAIGFTVDWSAERGIYIETK